MLAGSERFWPGGGTTNFFKTVGSLLCVQPLSTPLLLLLLCRRSVPLHPGERVL